MLTIRDRKQLHGVAKIKRTEARPHVSLPEPIYDDNDNLRPSRGIWLAFWVGLAMWSTAALVWKYFPA